MNVSKFNPEFLTIKELAHYGQDHDDPWVRKLAHFCRYAAFYVDTKTDVDPDLYFENLEMTMSELEDAARNSDNATEDALRTVEDLTTELDALKFDRSDDEKWYQLGDLKARMYKKSQELDDMRSSLTKSEREHAKLQKKYDELVEKHNTFTILATA
jgi:hypothetical protein